MAEQIADDILRQQIAQWTRAALADLVEHDAWSEPVSYGERTMMPSTAFLATSDSRSTARRNGSGKRHLRKNRQRGLPVSLAHFSVFLWRHVQRCACLLLSEAARPVRFFCTGGVAGLLQLGLLETLVQSGWNPVLANVVAALLTTQVNFVLSLLFTWYDRQPDSAMKQAFLIRWLSYQGVSLGALLLNQLVFVVAHLVMPILVAAELGLLVGASVNFVVMNRLVFRKPLPTSPVLS